MSTLQQLALALKGGKGSGNFGHSGRPGKRGGSGGGKGSGLSNQAEGLVYYRGTVPGETKKISTGLSEWDKNLFVTDTIKGAKLYGSNVERIALKPDAKILKEGTKEWKKAPKWKRSQNMLEWANSVANWAKQNGYDGAHFERQTDIGTVIWNKDVILSRQVA